jgi:hypothetical protein
MARRVFFSFHYERDNWRANQIRNSWVTRSIEEAGFWDKSLWEKAKKEGELAIKRMINKALEGTSVTVVLIGKETYYRKWVRYEIVRSYKRGNGILGIDMALMLDKDGNFSMFFSENPFKFSVTNDKGKKIRLSDLYPIYGWVWNDGYKNIGKWIEQAARKAGR